jgi:hypothetical protein
MDDSEARSLLGVGPGPHKANRIRKAYYKKCLEHHPDRGGQSRNFIKITMARDCLLSRDSCNRCESQPFDTAKFGMQALSFVLRGINFNLNSHIVIRVPLASALRSLIAPVRFEGATYYVPLWHHQLEFKRKRGSLIVHVRLELPARVTIADDRSIIIERSISLGELCESEVFLVECAGIVANVRNEQVFVQPHQRIDLGSIGLPLLGDEDVLTIGERARVYLDLSISDMAT